MMKKFTFIATLLLAFATMANAQMMDKFFFKIATDKDPGWTIQDGTNTVMTYGKEYLEVQQKKNAGRMLNYFFNDAAWQKDILSSHPTYKFTMDLKMTNMAARSDMEFTLLPVNACTSSDSRVSTHNYHWFNTKYTQEGMTDKDSLDYFFRWRVVTAPTEANGDYTIIINENPSARNDWVTTENADSLLTLSSQKLYKYSVVIDTKTKVAAYTIADENGTVLKSGLHNYVCAEDRAGIFVYSTNGTSTAQLSNMGLSYEAQGPFANEPSVDLFCADKEERDYFAQFGSGEVLHWIQLGDAQDVVSGQSYTDGEEYTVAYSDARDSRAFEEDEEAEGGQKIIYCEKSGTLKVWTSRENDDTNISDTIANEVTCEKIQLPVPVATITNVSEGYGKEYTITADNSNVLLNPTITIHYKKNDGTEGDLSTGETLTFTGAGSVELYSWDKTHAQPWYTQSETITVSNNTEYVTYSTTNYAWTKDECDNTKAGYTVTNIVDSSNKSHWDRCYSDQHYGYDADGNASVYVDGTEYVSEKQGFGFYAGSAIGTEDANWNVQIPEDIYTGFLPLVPATSDSWTANAWSIFPLQGIVYYATSGNLVASTTDATKAYAQLDLESKYTSDDAAKPNFYIIHKRGGYDRPDKGDCNSTQVCVAGESFYLYRYDTAICDVRIMTYKGFTPVESGIAAVNADETSAPAVKKVVTKNGIRIVKGDKAYSVAGAQVK